MLVGVGGVYSLLGWMIVCFIFLWWSGFVDFVLLVCIGEFFRVFVGFVIVIWGVGCCWWVCLGVYFCEYYKGVCW